MPSALRSNRSRLVITVLVAVLLGAYVFVWRGRESALLERHPQGVMGTECLLSAVGPRRTTGAALAEAEAALRGVEALMSTWIESSELSGFNAAGAGEAVALSPDTMAVLSAARAAFDASDGAFDVTCRPLIERWKRAGKEGALPSPPELLEARAASSWEQLELGEGVVTKRVGTACLDLGGIAKGYGIDRALERLRAAGCSAGLVDVGGDLCCFGAPPGKAAWEVGLRHPSGEGVAGTLALTDLAICTSGRYFRYAEIEGVRYSHIVDPRTGRPAERSPSVTVVAPSATLADAWATALSVLGREGLAKLPARCEALIVEERPDGELRYMQTPGFDHLWSRRPEEGVEVVGASADSAG